MTVPVAEEEIELPDTAVAALVESEGEAQDAISDNLIAILTSLWLVFEDHYDGSAVENFAQQVGRHVVAAQRAAGRITEAHLRQQILRMGETLPRQTFVDLPRDLRMGASVEEVYQRPVREVRYLESTDVPRETAIETARERLEKQALTDLQLARTVAAQQVLYRFPQASGWRRIIHPELGNVCGLCIAASDRIYYRLQKLDLHPGCVVEGTEVSADGVGAATRRRYEGPVAILRTASGQKLRLTPNHPVLTDQGWVSASRLRKGDRVVRHNGGQGDGRGRPDEQQSPARVEDVWRSLTVGAGLLPRTVPLAPEDLHGDGGDGEVDVVLVDRHLAPVGDVTFIEPCRETGFVDTHGRWSSLAASGSLDPFSVGGFSTPVRVVSGSREFESVGAGGLLVPSSGSFGIRADRYFSPSESADDRGPTYAELGRNLLDRLAGEVQLDELVDVEIEAFAGHVYNFQTVEGWYDASSLVVSNCKCTILPIVGSQDPGKTLNAEDLRRLYEAAGSTSTEALRAIRVETKVNGELGDILVPAGIKPKGPATVRRQMSDRALDLRKQQLQRQVSELRARSDRNQWHEDRLAQLEELLEAA